MLRRARLVHQPQPASRASKTKKKKPADWPAPRKAGPHSLRSLVRWLLKFPSRRWAMAPTAERLLPIPKRPRLRCRLDGKALTAVPRAAVLRWLLANPSRAKALQVARPSVQSPSPAPRRAMLRQGHRCSVAAATVLHARRRGQVLLRRLRLSWLKWPEHRNRVAWK